MKGWDHVFSTGWHTDSAGNKKLWTTDDLDRIVSSFKPEFHEPPLVIGHPADNAPAFGWVEGIKRVGDNLFLKYKDVAVEFQEWAKKKLFKKKSLAIYPDGSLRHIGYLGAMPPAIKGLPDYQFADSSRGEAITYEFCDWRMSTIGRIVMRIRDYLVEKEGADKADSIIGSWEVQDLLTPPQPIEECNPTFNEEDQMKPEEVQALITQAMTAASQAFSEQMKALGEQSKKIGEQVAALQITFAEGEESQARREFTAFCEGLATRILPAEIPTIVDQMMNLRKAQPVEFSEGGEKKTRSAVDDLKQKLQARAETIRFGEFATNDRASGSKVIPGDGEFAEVKVDEDRLKLHNDVLSYQEAHAGVSYETALAAVMNSTKGGQ